MSKYFKQKEFEYRIAPSVVVSGMVSGNLLPAEDDVGPEVSSFRVNAKVYTGPLDDVGRDLYKMGMNEDVLAEIEAAAMEVLCQEEEECA